jgi:hypothetical protein
MEHTHQPSGFLRPDCPACEQLTAARNQALAHLAEAVELLAGIHSQITDQPPVLRMNLAPIQLTGDAVDHCRSIDLTAKLAEALADTVDSLGHVVADEARQAQRRPESPTRMQRRVLEEIPSGEWSAAAVAQCNPDLYADVTDLFMVIDPLSYLEDVVAADCPEAAQVAYEQLVTGEWDGEL